MNRVKNFFLFWRHFVVGDDSTIAITVMWTLLLQISLSLNFINGWFVMPVVVLVLLTALLIRQVRRRTARLRHSPVASLLVAAVLPFIVVMVGPLLLFRYLNGMNQLHYTLIPLAVMIAVSVLVFLICLTIHRRYPLLAVVIFAIVAFVFLMKLMPPLAAGSLLFSERLPLVAWVFAAVIPIGFTAWCLSVLRMKTD